MVSGSTYFCTVFACDFNLPYRVSIAPHSREVGGSSTAAHYSRRVHNNDTDNDIAMPQHCDAYCEVGYRE